MQEQAGDASGQDRLEPLAMGKLKWRCRRGLLENDLFLQRFFAHYEAKLSVRQARGLGSLMELADTDLLDLLLGRRHSAPGAQSAEALEVLAQMRQCMREPPVQTSTLQFAATLKQL
jgi:antitoxin CptB